MKFLRLFFFTVTIPLLAACATRPPAHDLEAVAAFERANDPFEPLNRTVFAANLAVDKVITKPIAQGYRAVVPKPLRQGVHNALENIETPWSALNSLLQGKLKYTGKNIGRFVINTTLGIGGLFDVASKMGIEPHDEDLGQTLAVWGIGEGFYMVVPFLGPSNPRDFTGFTAQLLGDPVGIWIDDQNVRGLQQSILAAEVIDAREAALDTFDKLVEESQDPYAAVRSAYQQRRLFQIYDGSPPITEEDDLFGEETIDAATSLVPRLKIKRPVFNDKYSREY